MSSLPRPFPGLERYWNKRDQIFPGFGDAAQFDQETLFSAKTWEQNLRILNFVTMQIGQKPHRILDLTCGSGSFAITAAAQGCDVFSIDIDPAKLEMARYNAKLYGVDGRIEFVQGNSFDPHPYFHPRSIEPVYSAIYVDPPWGNGGYEGNREKPRSDAPFTLENLDPAVRGGLALYMTARLPLFVSLPRGAKSEILPCWAEDACVEPDGKPVFRTFLLRFSHPQPTGICEEAATQRIQKVAGPEWPKVRQRLTSVGYGFASA